MHSEPAYPTKHTAVSVAPQPSEYTPSGSAHQIDLNVSSNLKVSIVKPLYDNVAGQRAKETTATVSHPTNGSGVQTTTADAVAATASGWMFQVIVWGVFIAAIVATALLGPVGAFAFFGFLLCYMIYLAFASALPTSMLLSNIQESDPKVYVENLIKFPPKVKMHVHREMISDNDSDSAEEDVKYSTWDDVSRLVVPQEYPADTAICLHVSHDVVARDPSTISSVDSQLSNFLSRKRKRSSQRHEIRSRVQGFPEDSYVLLVPPGCQFGLTKGKFWLASLLMMALPFSAYVDSKTTKIHLHFTKVVSSA